MRSVCLLVCCRGVKMCLVVLPISLILDTLGWRSEVTTFWNIHLSNNAALHFQRFHIWCLCAKSGTFEALVPLFLFIHRLSRLRSMSKKAFINERLACPHQQRSFLRHSHPFIPQNDHSYISFPSCTPPHCIHTHHTHSLLSTYPKPPTPFPNQTEKIHSQ